jgi:two-component system OmpR family sensor kinase
LVELVPIFGLLIWFTVGRGLAPLRVLAAAVARRSAEDLQPLPATSLPSEVKPLVYEINLLLDRVESALDAQRGFIADAAHELRTPITAADLQLQLAERAGTMEEMRAALLPLRGGIARSQRLIEQLLSMARNQPEASALQREDFDLHALLQEVVGELAPLAIKKDIDIELIATGPIVYRGDRNALRVAVANLVDNAIRYTPPEGKVSVSLVQSDASLGIDVTDSGAGISEAERERVFDRFYRGLGHAETGSGLGLSIVERIVTRHGGTVRLASATPEGGLKAMIELPREAPAGA